MNVILLSSFSINEGLSIFKPVACYQLANWLRHHGYTVKVIDHSNMFSTDELYLMISRFITDDTFAIGVSTTFWQNYEDFYDNFIKINNNNLGEPDWVIQIRNRIEKRFPKLDWLLGGPNASYAVNLKKEWKMFYGEAENQLLAYADSKTGFTGQRTDFDITTTKFYYHESDCIQPHEAVPMELSRGCQFKCKFCQYPNIGKKKGTYVRSMECVRNEIIYNYENFGTTKYVFTDDTVNEDVDKMIALANIAQSLPFELQWAGFNRVDLLWSRPETVQILKDSGLKSAFFGIETFHPVASKIVGKGWFGKHAKDFLLELRDKWKGDITFFMTFIVGFPGEKVQDVYDSAKWLLDHNFYSWHFFPLRISRLTQLGEVSWKSEFDLNYAQYGYRFPKPLDNIYWESDDWNMNLAVEVAKNCNNYLDAEKRRFASGFQLFEMANLDVDINDYMWKPIVEYDNENIQQRREKFLNEYLKRTLTYKYQSIDS